MGNWSMKEAFKSFKIASELLYNQAMIDSYGVPKNVVAVPAYVVNTCLCLEVGLKYLIEQQGSSSRGHDLYHLHNQLNQTNKDKIGDYIKQFSKDQSKYDQWFMDKLNEVPDGFIQWRYFYEPTQTPVPGSHVVNTVSADLNFLKRFREALDNIITRRP